MAESCHNCHVVFVECHGLCCNQSEEFAVLPLGTQGHLRKVSRLTQERGSGGAESAFFLKCFSPRPFCFVLFCFSVKPTEFWKDMCVSCVFVLE